MTSFRTRATRAITLAAIGTATATLMVPALAGTAEATTVVGPSACGTIYPPGNLWTYPTTNLKLRSGPSTNYTALGLLNKGNGVEVQCKAKTAGWARVYVLNGPQDGRTGWVASKYLAYFQ
ncbi:SH3 domain-containing protein [Streptomyces sp. NPDC051572]|uniref:SH3 domain-containing protein n=1 Tax=Streptomyces sp. NPDC051572 TaxID=3155802 RepID=UPI00344B6B54